MGCIWLIGPIPDTDIRMTSAAPGWCQHPGGSRGVIHNTDKCHAQCHHEQWACKEVMQCCIIIMLGLCWYGCDSVMWWLSCRSHVSWWDQAPGSRPAPAPDQYWGCPVLGPATGNGELEHADNGLWVIQQPDYVCIVIPTSYDTLTRNTNEVFVIVIASLYLSSNIHFLSSPKNGHC